MKLLVTWKSNPIPKHCTHTAFQGFRSNEFILLTIILLWHLFHHIQHLLNNMKLDLEGEGRKLSAVFTAGALMLRCLVITCLHSVNKHLFLSSLSLSQPPNNFLSFSFLFSSSGLRLITGTAIFDCYFFLGSRLFHCLCKILSLK